MGILIILMNLGGEITNFKVLMEKYLIDEVMMGIYLNFSRPNYLRYIIWT